MIVRYILQENSSYKDNIMEASYIKCGDCGKFLSHKDFQEHKIKIEYTPDNEFGPEVIKHICEECQDENH